MRAAIGAFGPAGGDIVTSSLAGLGPVPGYGVYAATKAAVVSITGSVDAETSRRVRVHAVSPRRGGHRDADRGPHPRLAGLADRPLRRSRAHRRSGGAEGRVAGRVRDGSCSAFQAGAGGVTRLVEAQGRPRRSLENLFERILDSFEHVL